MKLHLFRTSDGKTAEIEIDPREDTVEALTILASAEFEVELVHLSHKNTTIYNGNVSQLSTPLSTLNLIENDLIQVIVPGEPSVAEASNADQELLRLFGNAAVGGATDTSSFLSNANPTAAAQPITRSAPPSLPPGAITSSSDIDANLRQQQDNDLINMFRNGLGAGGMSNAQANQSEQSTQHQQVLQRQDSNDPDLQRRIYEEIQKRNIEENLQNALEYTPEAFARVTMLYVPAEVNGYKMAAFVDSGAQMSVMSEDCADKCGLSRLIDRKWAGMAHGVGTTQIVGRVHMTMVKIAGQVLPMSISILAAKNMDFLIGLDQLKRHQMLIDLKSNELRLDEKSAVKFLSEHELPDHVKDGGAHSQEAEKLHNATDAAASSTTAKTTTNQAPQRREADQPVNTGNLTTTQQQAVKNLSEAFNVPPQISLQTLQAANWNEELAASMILSMTN